MRNEYEKIFDPVVEETVLKRLGCYFYIMKNANLMSYSQITDKFADLLSDFEEITGNHDLAEEYNFLFHSLFDNADIANFEKAHNYFEIPQRRENND